MCVFSSGLTIEPCGTPTMHPYNGNAITRWLSGPTLNLFSRRFEASLYVKMSSNKSIKVTFIECFMAQSSGLQWAGMSIEGQEKTGGVCESSSLAIQWAGDVPRPALSCRGMAEFFLHAQRSSLRQ